MTIHGKYDPTGFVWHKAAYHNRVAASGRSEFLVQPFTNEAEHSALNAPEYVAVFEALMAWIDQGAKPDASSVATLCEAGSSRYGAACLFDEEYRPATGR